MRRLRRRWLFLLCLVVGAFVFVIWRTSDYPTEPLDIFRVLGRRIVATHQSPAPPNKLGSPAVRHLIWITFDALRADHLELYGYPLATAPLLTGWAKRAVVFDRCIAQSVCTHISMPVLLFGSYYHHLSANQLSSDINGRTALPELLRSRGYRTALFSNHGALIIERHFDVVRDNGKLSEMEIAKEAVRWQLENDQRPTFLWIHLMAPHSPQPRSGPAYRRFLAARQNPALFPPGYYDIPPRLDQRARTLYAQPLWAAYDAAIGKSDRAINLFLRRLSALGVLRDSLVAISADHGEHMDEQPMLYHQRWTWRSLVHVPLIMLLPESLQPVYGRSPRIKDVVRHIDLAPTFLAAALPGSRDSLADGESLWPLLAGAPGPERLIFSDGVGNKLPYSRSIESGHFVLWRIDGLARPEYRLFDLTNVPEETTDVQDRYPQEFRRLKTLLDPLCPPPTAFDLREEHLTPEQIGRLKSLGYL